MVKLPEHIEDAIEEQGWSIRYTDDGYVQLETHSPLGEDLVETIEIWNFAGNLRDRARCFDADDHAVMWADARYKVSGVPDSLRDLFQDAEDIQRMLDELVEAVEKAEEKEDEMLSETEESAKAVAIAYYESCDFELLCDGYECVDGGMGLVFQHEDVMHFVDVYDHHEELDIETKNRVKDVVGNYLRKNPHPEVEWFYYDVVTAMEHPNGVRLDFDIDLVEFEEPNTLEKLRYDMEKLLHERFMDDASMGEQVFSAQELRGFAEEIEKFYLPRPRFEDGEPVRVGDNVGGLSVGAICVYDTGWFKLEDEHGNTIEDAPYRKRVMRGITHDAEGVNTEPGDTVWATDPTTEYSAEVIRCGSDNIDVRWEDGIVDYYVSPKDFVHHRMDSIERVIEDMRGYAQGGVTCIENDVDTFANRLDAIINNR